MAVQQLQRLGRERSAPLAFFARRGQTVAARRRRNVQQLDRRRRGHGHRGHGTVVPLVVPVTGRHALAVIVIIPKL